MPVIGKNLGLTFGWAAGSSGWGSPLNSDLAILDVLASGSVAGIISSPTGDEADGASYIVSTAPSGDFSEKPNNIAIKYGGSWLFITPLNGMMLTTQTDGKVYQYKSGAWIEFTSGGDVVISEMTGATSSVAGTSGIVPAPAAGSQNKSLLGDATFGFSSDVAISGDQSDLASARGLFDTVTKGAVDCNTLTEQGVYNIYLIGTLNGPGFLAKLIVFSSKDSTYVNQIAIASATADAGAIRVKYRTRTKVSDEIVWSPWSEGVMSGRIGDGIEVNNGIISVPEYDGATDTTVGVSGLVPPAATNQLSKSLLGNGSWGDPAYAATSAVANKCACTPNIISGHGGSKLPPGGTWRVVHYQGDSLRIIDHPGGYTFTSPKSGDCYFIAIRIA